MPSDFKQGSLLGTSKSGELIRLNVTPENTLRRVWLFLERTTADFGTGKKYWLSFIGLAGQEVLRLPAFEKPTAGGFFGLANSERSWLNLYNSAYPGGSGGTPTGAIRSVQSFTMWFNTGNAGDTNVHGLTPFPLYNLECSSIVLATDDAAAATWAFLACLSEPPLKLT